MDNTRIAWQKSVWVFLTVEGDRKKLITPAQRTTSGLACRNIFNTQFVQLLEAYHTYGPHKGFFVPRLEPSSDPEVASEVHWDKLSDVLHEPGTAPAPAADKPIEAGPSLKSILEDHNQKKKQKSTTDHADESPPPIAETQCTTDDQALPAVSAQESTLDLAPIDVYTRLKADYDRRKGLAKRERIGLLKKSTSGVPINLVGIEKVFDDMNKQFRRMKTLLETQCQEELQSAGSDTQKSEEIIDALDRIVRMSDNVAAARSMLRSRDYSLVEINYSCVIQAFENPARFCTTVVTQKLAQAVSDGQHRSPASGCHSGGKDLVKRLNDDAEIDGETAKARDGKNRAFDKI